MRRPQVMLLLVLPLLSTTLSWGRFSPQTGDGARQESQNERTDPESFPIELQEIWLRFHEAELCLGIDTVFRLDNHGMEVWCLVEDEKSYQKFLDFIESARGSFDVTLYTTRPVVDKKTPQDNDPPPSLWNNAELRSFLQDPFVMAQAGGGVSIRSGSGTERGPEFFLKQRMLMFAQQTLEWNEKMKRYALDLPALVEAGFGATGAPAMKARAAAVALAHAQGIDKHAERLTENLSQALPKKAKNFRLEQADKSAAAKSSPQTSAAALSRAAQGIARRVYRFIHPQHHTVGVVDLREPSLLSSLRTLRRMVAGFQSSARK